MTSSFMTCARALILLSFVAGASGCAYQTPAAHVPDGIPPLSVASTGAPEVTVVDASVDPEDDVTAKMTRDAATILTRAAENAVTGGEPSRVRVAVTLRDHADITDALHQDGIAIVGMWPVVFGMVSHRQHLEVDLTIESGGRTWTGHGEGDKIGSIYVPARRRALAVALDQALADAACAERRAHQTP